MLPLQEYHTSNARHKAIYDFLAHIWRCQPAGYMFLGVKQGDRWKTFPIDGDKHDDDKHLKRLIEKYADGNLYFRISTFVDPEGVKDNAHRAMLNHFGPYLPWELGDIPFLIFRMIRGAITRCICSPLTFFHPIDPLATSAFAIAMRSTAQGDLRRTLL